MGLLVSGLGALLVLVVLRDVFHTLFHPASEGSLSRLALGGIWRLAGKLGTGAVVRAGPLGFLAVGGGWALLLVTGFALVYWPHLEAGFVVADELGAQESFLDAFYFSAVAISTLGFGDVAPEATPWRLVTVFEGVVGLGLATAVVSWLLSIYAALERRRSLAGTVFALADGEPPSETMVESLAASVQATRTDLVQHAATYFFRSPDPKHELAAALPALRALAAAAPRRGGTLRASIDLLAGKLARDFLHVDEGDPDAVLRAYARDHRVEEEAAALLARVSARGRAGV
jgi:hypothetical protein